VSLPSPPTASSLSPDTPHFDVTASSSSFDPQRLTDWTEFHRQAEQLPPEVREVFDLTYYQSLPQSEVAKVLNISERTVQRRWQSAREALQHFLNDQFPEDR
jgi:DNA-directed RNA polymerase specialized sigma24 family protein